LQAGLSAAIRKSFCRPCGNRFESFTAHQSPRRSLETAPHPRLEAWVRRHRGSRWQAPVHPGSRAAFAEFLSGHRADRPLILDSGCGTGASGLRLAEMFPAAEVVGIDQSAHRLARAPSIRPANLRLLRARAEDFWRLLLDQGIRPELHFLLYPNPWPKPCHLGRRWHGHPVFPTLLALGGRIELRCNWSIYAEEFRRAALCCGVLTSAVVSFACIEPLSPFEKKYSDSGHELFRLTLPASPRSELDPQRSPVPTEESIE
jgi:tRNA (guanine-N7-)-methyltransferase